MWSYIHKSVVFCFYISCTVIFCTNFVWKISHSKKYSARLNRNWASVFKLITPYYCHISMNFEFFWSVFKKTLYYKFSWKSVHWDPSYTKQEWQKGMAMLWVAFGIFDIALIKRNTHQQYTQVILPYNNTVKLTDVIQHFVVVNKRFQIHRINCVQWSVFVFQQINTEILC